MLHTLGIPSLAHAPDSGSPGPWKGLANPFTQCPSARVAQCPYGGSHAPIVGEAVFNGCLLLLLRELGLAICIACRQIELLLILAIPALQRISGGVTRLPDGGPNAFSFNGKFRDECLSLEWFRSRREAVVLIESWRNHYNEVRPHSSLQYLTPAEFKKQLRQDLQPAVF